MSQTNLNAFFNLLVIMDDINNREPEKAEDSHVIVMHALSDARNSAATLNLPMNPRAKLNGPKKYGIQAKESKMDRKKYCCCFYTRSGCLSVCLIIWVYRVFNDSWLF